MARTWTRGTSILRPPVRKRTACQVDSTLSVLGIPTAWALASDSTQCRYSNRFTSHPRLESVQDVTEDTHQIRFVDWLDQVVFGSLAHPPDFVGLLIFGCHDDDGDV